MLNRLAFVAVFALTVLRPSAQVDRIKAAADAIGATNLKTIRYTGIGANFSVGQSPNPKEPWPRVTVKSYEASINYDTASMRVEMLREQGAIAPRGGGVPFTGQQRVTQVVSGQDAWNIPPPPSRGPGAAAAPAPAPTGAAPPPAPEQPPQPQPAAVMERVLQIWLTPHGFLRAAMANRATTSVVPGGVEAAFMLEGKYRFTGLINAKNQVERVRTWIDNPVMGDMLIEVEYRDYEKVEGGIEFPMHILQRQGGPLLELWLTSVQPNVPVDISAPATVKGATLPPVVVEAERIADGVYYLTGGSHHSVAIELADQVVVVEAPLDETRSLAVIAKIKAAIPGKPIGAVINTHHHFDHAGGLRTYVDEGATIVTAEGNRGFYETAWSAPRTINPDRLARSAKTPRLVGFADKHTLTDGARTIEVHRIADNPHHDGFAMVYVPWAKLLIEADAYAPAVPAAPAPAAPAVPATPPVAAVAPPFPPPPPAANPTAINLYNNIKRLGLGVERIAALHGPRVATMEEFASSIGRAE